MSREYLRTDKNGTKIYRVLAYCPRCGGTGYTPYVWVDGGICFECGGNGGAHYEEEKEYTEEYLAKLEERRAKRQAKKDEENKSRSVEINKEFFERQGFNEDGKTWAVLGETFSIKEELKSKGAKWMNAIGKWVFNHDIKDYSTVELNVDDIFYKDTAYIYRWNNYKTLDETYSEKIRSAEAVIAANDITSEWFGEVGKRYDLNLVFVGSHSWEVTFCYQKSRQYLHKFKDESGNVFVWKTGSPIFIQDGDDYRPVKVSEKVSLKGTIKEHGNFKGDKQTVLTRCKVMEVSA